MRSLSTTAVGWKAHSPSSILTKMLQLALVTSFLSLEVALAIPGEYFTSSSLGNKWLPNPLKIVTAMNKDVCLKYCVKDSRCNGFAISAFERKCRMYDVQIGTPPVKNNGYVLYIKKKTEEEGYYAYGTQYIRLIKQRLNARNAAKVCAKEKGLLVAVRNHDISALIWKLMIRSNVWEALIGVSDEKKEGTWIYSDTGPVTYSNWDWKGMWPRKDLNCVIVVNTIDGPVWKHANCWHKNYFFCQIPMF